MASISEGDRAIVQQVVTEMAYLDQIDIVDFANFYMAVDVPTYAAYALQCKGTQKKLVTVAVDETDGNRIGNKYYYEGKDIVNPDPQF